MVYVAKIVEQTGVTCIKFSRKLCRDYEIRIGDEIDWVHGNGGEIGIKFLHKELTLWLKKPSHKRKKR